MAPDPQDTQSTSSAENVPGQEPVWSYRGYKLRHSEFITAMVHYYRAEVQRSNVWRSRLDATTNWAVVTAGAAISFSLASPQHHYGVIILDTMLVAIFLWIEARRYRYYELWSLRARMIETDFFAAMLVPPFGPQAQWGEHLAESLLQPDFPISMWEALGRRYRRNYIWIFMVLGIAWVLKTFLHPVPAASWQEFIVRASLGPVPGWVMLTIGLIYNGLIFLLGLLTAGLHEATGEVLPKYGELPIANRLWQALHLPAEHIRPERTPGQGKRRQQLMALIITTEPKKVSDRVLKDMHRGMTEIEGRGMYSEQQRSVLMVALTATEMPQLRALVAAEDAQAFVVVVAAQQVLGRGFEPLTT